MTTPKAAGASCPSCGSHCAEFKRMQERFYRWSCSCGAGGVIPGAGAPVPPKVVPGSRESPYRHWRDVARKA